VATVWNIPYTGLNVVISVDHLISNLLLTSTCSIMLYILLRLSYLGV